MKICCQRCGLLWEKDGNFSPDKLHVWREHAMACGICGSESFPEFDGATWELLFDSLLRFPLSAMRGCKVALEKVESNDSDFDDAVDG